MHYKTCAFTLPERNVPQGIWWSLPDKADGGPPADAPAPAPAPRMQITCSKSLEAQSECRQEALCFLAGLWQQSLQEGTAATGAPLSSSISLPACPTCPRIGSHHPP